MISHKFQCRLSAPYRLERMHFSLNKVNSCVKRQIDLQKVSASSGRLGALFLYAIIDHQKRSTTQGVFSSRGGEAQHKKKLSYMEKIVI